MASTDPPTEQMDDNVDTIMIKDIKRSPLFWFNDGNVVLQTADTQFRVHRSLLAFHSEVMKDCFEISQEGDETVEGCPVLRLDDSTEDIENLCGLLFGMYQVESETVGFSYLGTMLRLGRKYEIANFRTMALKRLRRLFPRDLYQWGKAAELESEFTSLFHRPTSKGFLFDVINSAYEEDSEIPSILPAAFLFLYMKHSLSTILSGVKRADKSLAILGPQAMKAAMLGQAHFMDNWIGRLLNHLEIDEEYRFKIAYNIPAGSCTKKESCMLSLANVLGQLNRTAVGIDPVCIPLQIQGICYAGSVPDPEISIPQPFCDSCTSILEDSFYNSRQEWWKGLPSSFDLPPWKKMKDFDMY